MHNCQQWKLARPLTPGVKINNGHDDDNDDNDCGGNDRDDDDDDDDDDDCDDAQRGPKVCLRGANM